MITGIFKKFDIYVKEDHSQQPWKHPTQAYVFLASGQQAQMLLVVFMF